MELIIINENKLKITMTAPDMKEYGIDENEFHLSLIDTKNVLKRILSKTNIKTGFENIGKGEKLLIQLYPEKQGGCELYITRISLDETDEEEMELTDDEAERYLLPQSSKKTVYLENRPSIYMFDNLEDLILACKELIKRSFNQKSSLFTHGSSKFYLLITENTENSPTEKEKSRQYSFLSEFGEQINDKNFHIFLSEYGKRVIEADAAIKLSQI